MLKKSKSQYNVVEEALKFELMEEIVVVPPGIRPIPIQTFFDYIVLIVFSDLICGIVIPQISG